MTGALYTNVDGGFSVRLPPGWSATPDAEHGGAELWGPKEHGPLHLVGIPQPDGEWPDPAEELYAFLDEQGVELEEDEVEDVALGDSAELALCEYLAEDDDPAAGATYWLIAVATTPGSLVFGTYSAAAGEQDTETVREILASLSFSPPG